MMNNDEFSGKLYKRKYMASLNTTLCTFHDDNYGTASNKLHFHLPHFTIPCTNNYGKQHLNSSTKGAGSFIPRYYMIMQNFFIFSFVTKYNLNTMVTIGYLQVGYIIGSLSVSITQHCR